MDEKLSKQLTEPCRAYRAALPAWERADDLCSGTDRMRERSTTYLPRRVGEDDKSYEFRIKQAVLHPGLASAIGDLASRPFERPVTLRSAGEGEALIEADADTLGTGLSEFALHKFRGDLKFGIAHTLVDTTAWGEHTHSDELEGRVRPYFIPISPLDLLGWRFRRGKLVQIRFREFSDVEDGEFGERRVQRIAVLSLVDDGSLLARRWELRKAEEKSQWIELEPRLASPPQGFGFDAIPMVSVPFGPTDGLAAKSPLDDLAWLNLRHWQAASRHSYALEFASAGLLTISGMSREELDRQGGVSIGGAHVLCVPKVEGKAYYAEHSGAALGASKEALDKLERQMRSLGQRHLEERANATATGESVDERRATSNLKQWIRLLEQGLRRCFALSAQWRGTKLSDEFQVQIFSDFSPMTDHSTDALRDAYAQGAISQKTYLRGLQRRSVIDEDLDIDKEIEETKVPTASAWDHRAGSNADPDDQPAEGDAA